MELLVDDLSVVDDQVDRTYRAADLFGTAPQLGRLPDVVLIAKGDPVAAAAACRADEVLAEAEFRFVPVEGYREGCARGEVADDLLGRIGRTVVTDLQLERLQLLPREAVELLFEIALAIECRHGDGNAHEAEAAFPCVARSLQDGRSDLGSS